MSFVSRFRGSRLAMAMVISVGMTCAVEAVANGQQTPRVVKRAILHAQGHLEQLSQLGSKVGIKAACMVGACVVNFSALTAAAADLSALQADGGSSKSRGVNSIFAREARPDDEKSLASEGFDGSWWLGYGIYKDDGGNLGTVRVGVNGEHPNFNVYYTAATRHHHDMTDGIDDIGVKVRTFSGGSGLLIKNGEGEMSYGYGSVDLFTANKLSILDFQAYLAHYHKGPFQVAIGGIEYMDKELDALEGSDSVRGVYTSLSRVGYKDTYTTPHGGIDITFKANSVLGLGDVGFVELGRFWQGEMNDFAGESDLEHALYYKGSASIGMTSKNGRVALSIGGEYGTTIEGEIDVHGEGENGDFILDRRTLSLRSSIELIPDDIRFESLFDWYWQKEYAELDGSEIDQMSKGIWGRFALVKPF